MSGTAAEAHVFISYFIDPLSVFLGCVRLPAAPRCMLCSHSVLLSWCLSHTLPQSHCKCAHQTMSSRTLRAQPCALQVHLSLWFHNTAVFMLLRREQPLLLKRLKGKLGRCRSGCMLACLRDAPHSAVLCAIGCLNVA